MLPSAKFFLRKVFISALLLNFLFLSGLLTTARGAGEIDPSFNAGAFVQPNGSATGVATTVVAQPDGKILIGGNFEVNDGVLRSSITRVNADGSLDTTFNPPPLAPGIGTGGQPGTVEAIVLQPDGRIVIAGTFTIAGMNLRAPIVRLNADGSLDSSFNFALQGNSSMSGSIKDVEIRPNGKIIIAGIFNYTSPAGVARANFAQINADGSTDETFNPPGFTTQIDAIELQPDGKLVGFSTPGNMNDRFIKRLNEDGSVDSSFNAVLVSGFVFAMKIQPDGKILIGGVFFNVNNFSRQYLARLNADGTLDETFNSPFILSQQAFINDIETGSDGKILISGAFSAFSPQISTPILMRLNNDGTIDSSLNFNRVTPNNGSYMQIFDLAPLANGQIMLAGMMNRLSSVGAATNRINADGSYDASFFTLLGNRATIVDIAPLPNGQTVIAGVFGAVDRTIRPSLARLNADGSVDTTFNPTTLTGAGQDPLILAVTPLADNRIMVGGQFLGGMLVRLNPDGSRDTTFNPSLSTSGPVYDIAVQPDGKVIGVGMITPSVGSPRYVMRFNPDGSVDSSFVFSQFNGTVVRKVLLQPDGQILIAGLFTSISGLTRNSIARLKADGSLDTSFNPLGGANNTVTDIARQADGKILISGLFTVINGVSRQGIARLNADGSLDTTFDATANSSVFTVELQADGKILVGGSFTSIGGAPRNRIARLNPNGTIDFTFNVGTGADGSVNSIELDANGKVLAGGVFVRYNNTPRVSLVRLLNSAVPRATPFDYDGDGKSDLSVFRPAMSFWYIARPTGTPSQNFDAVQFGASGDVIVPADYDGDGKTDVAVWRPSDGTWYLLQSSAGFRAAQFGANGDIPAPGDFDGDGKANLAVFRPATGAWYIARTTGIPSQNFDSVPFGANGDKPIAGADFDGDGKADVAVFRPSTGDWYRLNSSNNQFVGIHFGIAEDKPVAADYDGDGKTDLAVFRPSDGTWYRINSGGDTFTAIRFGIAEDRPAPADYDGDGKTDLSVFRPSEGVWYLLRSTQGFTGIQFGAGGDVPTPNAFVR
jgi:uncharacterized delta-60 repeat protein